MTDIRDGITEQVPDFPETRLAYRTWRLARASRTLLSINAGQATRRGTWFLPNAISSPAGEWTKSNLMMARCSLGKDHKRGIPGPECSCGIYATTSLDVINDYLSEESPVLGVVELGGRTIPATNGWRAQAARVAAILLVDEMFTLPNSELKRIAEEYRVPALVPHSTDPEDYRSAIRQPGIGVIDWDGALRILFEEEGNGP